MIEVLQSLVQLELKVGELYETCARRWPEDDQFWLEVAQQETVHAQAIERMSSLVSSNPAHFLPAKVIRAAAINTIIAGIDKTMEQVRTRQISKINALTIACDIENSIMEKKFYEMIKTDNADFIKLCNDIMKQTMHHKEHFNKRRAELKT